MSERVINLSDWTYVNGCIKVDVPGRTQPEKRYILETVLDHLPLVTGSERNMSVHIVQCSGHNTSKSFDEFGNSNTQQMRARTDGYFYGWMETQSKYIIVVEGSLRDRCIQKTTREFCKWMFRLCKRIWVEDALVEIKGWGNSVLIRENPNKPFLNIKDETDWYSYLMWDEDNSDLPYENHIG